jgi:uncharacterized protein YqjF (DUF2071 family)
MVNHDFNNRILEEVAHRPWPMPNRPWLMTQTWNDLLFAHWRVDVSQLRAKIPSVFELDLFDGDAWVGVVPFYMTNVAPRGVPSLPWVSEFAELNVRTYVRVADRPGVFFFSLDAANALAVQAARSLLNLPYYTAAMSVTSRPSNVVEYRSERRSEPSAQFDATYTSMGATFAPVEGSLEYFLTERYCLYHLHHTGAPYRLDIHHPPWPLQSAEADLKQNTMAAASGIALPGDRPVLHFAKRQDMVAWPPATIDSSGAA